MGSIEKGQEVFEVTVDKSPLEILKAIEDGKKNYSWTDSVLGGTIDYQEIEIKDARIEITTKPFAPSLFGALGTITIDIKREEGGKAKIIL